MEYLKPFENKYLLEIQLEDLKSLCCILKIKISIYLDLVIFQLIKNITVKKACSVIKDRIGEMWK